MESVVHSEGLALKLVEFLELSELQLVWVLNRSCREAASDGLWREIVLQKFWKGDDVALGKEEGKVCPLNVGEDDVVEGALVKAPSSKLGSAKTWRAAAMRWTSLSDRVEVRENLPVDARRWTQVARAWRLLEERLGERESEASRAILKSLRGPATVEDLEPIRPRTLRYAYAVHDGQDLAFDDARDKRWAVGIRRAQRSIFHGLFGGFSAYDYVVVGRFAPSGRVVLVDPPRHNQTNPPFLHSDDDDDLSVEEEEEEPPPTFSSSSLETTRGRTTPGSGVKDHSSSGSSSSSSQSVTFAWSFREDRRFVVNAKDDAILVYDALHAVEGGVAERAAPEGASFGDWFAEYARRVATGYYDFGLAVPDDADTESIVLFRNEVDGVECSYEKTNGVECRASALYLPVHPHGFAYSIRLNLAADAPVEHCQLKTRRWLITNVDAAGRDRQKKVIGDGVVGKFPKLKRGGGWRDDFQADDIGALGFARAVRKGIDRQGVFIYQSFSGLMANADAMNTFEGEIDFYPNEFLEADAPPFQVKVPPFLLKRPDFIF